MSGMNLKTTFALNIHEKKKQVNVANIIYTLLFWVHLNDVFTKIFGSVWIKVFMKQVLFQGFFEG
jgi:hypothetical protein